MMNLLRVYGENWCQYRSFDEKLPPGLICLLGMNGSGKSNLVRAIYLCLVGEVYGNPNLVQDGQMKGHVSIDAEVPQGVFTVTRRLKHNIKTRGTSIQHELHADWLEQPLKKKADVAGFLAPLLGVPIATLQYVSFALQGKFANLMTCDHVPRAKMINTFMGLERAETLRLILKGSMDSIADMPDRTEALAAAECDLDFLGKESVQAEATLQELQSNITETVEAAYQNAIRIKKLASSETRDNQLAVLQGALETWEAKLVVAEAEYVAIPDTQVMSSPDSAAKYNYQRYQTAATALEAAKDNLKTFQAQPKPEPAKDEDRAALSAEKIAERDELTVTLMSLKTKICSFGSGVCPTCKQTLKVDFDITKVQAEYDTTRIKHEEIARSITAAGTAVATADEQVAAYERQLQSREEVIPRAEELLGTLQQYAGFDTEQYDKDVQAYEQALVQSSNKTRALQHKSKCELEIQRTQAQATMLENQEVATQAEQLQAQAMVDGYLAVTDRIKDAAFNRDQATNKVTICKGRITTLHEDMTKGAANIAAIELLQQARDKLHVEQLPRLAAQSSINAINRAMKKYLDMFAFPYGFRLDENMDFVVDLDTSPDHPAEILSGGEEVRAALAMRFALMDVFSAGCGILIIDEPTTALDTDAVTALVEVLGTAAAYFKKRNIKILCPTHAIQLAAVADAVITIGE